MNHTFIKLYRDITDWQWYRDGNTFRVYLHLMLRAAFHEYQKGKDLIRIGDLETNYAALSSELGLGIHQVRRSLDLLKESGEITVARLPSGLRIHLQFYEKPPGFNCQTAIIRQSDGNPTAVKWQSFLNIKNIKNEKNAEREEERLCPPAGNDREEEKFFSEDAAETPVPFGSASEPDEREAEEQSVYPGENGNLMIDAEGLHRLREALPDTWREKAEYLSSYLAAHPEKRYADHVSLILLWAKQDRDKEKTAARTAPDPWERINRLAHGGFDS